MKTLLPLFLIFISSQPALSQQWQTEAATDRGRLQYYYNGNLGFSVRTSAGGGWAWQLVDGGNNSYFHVDYPTGNVGIGTISPSEKLSIRGTGSIGAEIVTDGATSSRPVLGFVRGSGFWHIGMNMDMGNTDNFHFRFNGSSYPLTIQAASGHIGVGTTAPASQLHIASDASHAITLSRSSGDYGFRILRNAQEGNVYFQVATGAANSWETKIKIGEGEGPATKLLFNPDGGNVGIGTSNPAYKLQVSGGAICLDEDQPLRGGGRWLISGNSSWVQVGTANPGIGLRLDAGAAARMFIDGTTGNVGIATSNPTKRLTVNGTIYGKEVKVDLAVPGPDYVFEKDYNLLPLSELEAYVRQNKHLPEIPSAKEMEENGLNLKEMNLLLLKKVEELTLHLIEQNKAIAKQHQINELLLNEVEKLKNKK